jgi:hypothetical protein
MLWGGNYDLRATPQCSERLWMFLVGFRLFSVFDAMSAENWREKMGVVSCLWSGFVVSCALSSAHYDNHGCCSDRYDYD